MHDEQCDIHDLVSKSNVALAEWPDDRWTAKSKNLQELQKALEEKKKWTKDGEIEERVQQTCRYERKIVKYSRGGLLEHLLLSVIHVA